MKRILFCLLGLLLIAQPNAQAQKKCGFADQMKTLNALNPAFSSYINARKATLQQKADNYKLAKLHSANKTTSFPAAVPVIFHIVIDSAQYNEIGGLAGIKQRCDSQIAVLNRDYNAQNPDAALIPSGWLPYYGNAGINFGLARLSPTGTRVEGYEIKIISASGIDTGSYPGYIYPDRYGSVKHSSTGGLDAWDVTEYMNVWCINFLHNPSGGILLGLTVPKSYTPSGGAPTPCPDDNEQGICMYYQALGKRATSADVYPAGADEGRTLTHEVGHLFEIWHVWGDDGGLCPWSSGGYDDGLQDTPPQSTSSSGFPIYNVTGGTVYDGCKDSSGVNVQPIGIACLDYMDYTDDSGMHLFTPDQAATMDAQLYNVGENPGLVSHWELTAKVPEYFPTNSFDINISPNPTKDVINVAINTTTIALQQISVTNTLGQEVYTLSAINNQQNLFVINLSTMSKGIYFVKCTFATGTSIQKILLQ